MMDRFFEKIRKTNDCWWWLAGKDKDGYGRIKVRGKTFQAHRFSWCIHNKKIPDGMSVLHQCDNSSCVNPEHLFLGTALDNNRDRDSKGRNGYSKRTHCPKGHEYSLENTTVWNKTRKCRICISEYHKKRNAKRVRLAG